ncbi:unnamed protein product [Schistosoma margrebowiei]|uniref:Late endosomal/lysosomal adaptor and MAPK and MTOR activator 4 n=1 Tax=Schistosoma margrebowiei TaxID=48269 RepID=A0AA84ZC43_9TREM|nr:unnamed protein product [Schistosoma margrebowiei]
MPMSTCHVGSVVTPLAVLNRLPGWLGTLVISPDGSVLQSAGELVNNKELAQHFAAIANRVGRLLNMEGERKTQQFKRLTNLIAYLQYQLTSIKRLFNNLKSIIFTKPLAKIFCRIDICYSK